jgi:hypothetical protein
MAKNGKTTKPHQTPQERSDALALVTDDELKAALRRKREFLTGQIADINVNKMMPDYDSLPEALRAEQLRNEQLLVAAIRDIDRRLNAASALLRSFGKMGLPEPEKAPVS